MISCFGVPRGLRRHAARVAVGALVLTMGVVGSASAASAGRLPTIFQSGSTQGIIVAGSKFSTYLQVSGNTGAVTYTQASGTPSLSVSSAGLLVAGSSLAAGTYQASGNERDANGGTGTWTFQLTVVPPAPGTFASTAVKVYQSEYDYNSQSGQGGALESVSDYQQQMGKLSPLGRAMFYRAVQGAPEWLQIPGILQSVAAAGRSTKASAGKRTAHGAAGAGDTPGAYQLGSSDGDENCDGGPSDAIVFGLQIVVDVAGTVYNGTTAAQIDADSLPEGLKEADGIAEFIASTAANVVLGAAQIAEDSVSYAQSAFADCEPNDMFGYSANIDNTTVQSYNLLTAASVAIDKVEQTATTTDQDVLNLQSQVAAMQATLASSLAQDVKALQSAIGSDTQGIVTQLQTDNGAIQQKETDSRADQWTIEIENALVASGGVAPASLLTPGPNGGMLTLPNAVGVSVQSVVLADMQAMQSAGATIPGDATDACNDATQDLADSFWQTAFEDFRNCYHDFATLP